MKSAAALTTPSPARPSLVDTFALRCWARGYLWSIGEFVDLAEAVDILWHDAERDGLVAQIGQDQVQRIIADAFAEFFEAER